MPLTRAYAVLHIKAVDTDQRTIAGIASTPEPDRMGDVVEPLGIAFKNPLPLLLYHDAKKPVGQVTFQTPTVAGLAFTATFPTVAEPGALRDRIDEAWQSVKAGLLAGVSIGFRSMGHVLNKETGGLRFLKTEILELSLVAIPAHAGATISSIKSLDLAASGPHSSRDRDPLPIVRVDKGAPPMDKKTISEQITSYESSRVVKHDRMTAIMTKSAEAGATLDQAETDEYDGLAAELKAIDAHLVRLRDLEATNVAKAIPITAATPDDASRQRSTVPVISVKSTVAQGTAFIRYCQALAVSHGSTLQAVEYAKKWHDSTPKWSSCSRPPSRPARRPTPRGPGPWRRSPR